MTDTVLALAEASGLVDAAMTDWGGAFDARTIWTADGARSAGGWLAARTELSRPASMAVVRRARALRRWQVVDEAFHAARLGTAKVTVLLRAAEVDPGRFATYEAELVALVQPLTVEQARRLIDHWIERARAEREAAGEGDDAAPDPEIPNELNVATTLGGRSVGTWDLDPVSGELVTNAIRAIIDERFRAGTYQADDGIALRRRQADALVELARRGARSGTSHGGPRPSVSLIIDAKTLNGEPTDSLEDLLARHLHTEADVPVARTTAERLCCTADLTAILTRMAEDGSVETLGVTDLQRFATTKQWAALELRDRGCAFPGCHAPPSWCDAHHLVPAEIGGPTLLHNLVMLCSHHHHLVHEGRWRLARGPDGRLRLHDPDGREHPVPPHGTKPVR